MGFGSTPKCQGQLSALLWDLRQEAFSVLSLSFLICEISHILGLL